MLWDEPEHCGVKQKAFEFLAKSFDAFYEHTIATDANAQVTWISEAYCKFLGLSHSPIGQHITSIIPSSFVPRVIASGEPVFLDVVVIKEQWVVVSVIPLENNQGEIVGSFGFVATDSISPLLAKYNRLQKQLDDARNKLAQEHRSKYRLSQIVGHSDALQAVKKQIRQAARFDISVLLTGETGTGKELFAHALHDLSSRNAGPFVSTNVAAIPENLIEAEFFGVAPGAYTGATKAGRQGKFELANGGTLFLDEIGDMPMDLQSKLLRVLQEKEFEPIGSNTIKKTDIRIVAATSRNLLSMVEDGQFRPDLYYRLNALPIHLPPLRDRLGDIEALSEKFIDEISNQLGIAAKELTASAVQILSHQPWAGNVRELRNVIERACVLSNSSVIDAAYLTPMLAVVEPRSHAARAGFVQSEYPSECQLECPTASSSDCSLVGKPARLSEITREAERSAIVDALAYTRGRKTEAAKVLGISRANLYGKINKLGLR